MITWYFVATFMIHGLACVPQGAQYNNLELVQPGCHSVAIRMPDRKTCEALVKLNPYQAPFSIKDAYCDPRGGYSYTVQ